MRPEVTRDERLPLLLLHQLRRNHVEAGNDFLPRSTEGEMDEEPWRTDFWSPAFLVRAPREVRHDGKTGPHLLVV